MADYPHRAVIEEEVRQLWKLLRYKYAHGNARAVQDAANHLEGFLKLIERNRPSGAEGPHEFDCIDPNCGGCSIG